jgi:rod shape-determining protein MreD
MKLTSAPPLRPEPASRWDVVIAAMTVIAGSLVTLIPIVTTVPFLPPCGLLMLLAWRLRRPELFASWAAAPLGLFDDLVSGQPIGAAMAFWTLCVLAIDVLDTRLVWRDFWQDWLIASGAVGFCLIASRLVASPIAAQVDTVLLLQIAMSCALYPLAAFLCARIEQRRRRQFQ